MPQNTYKYFRKLLTITSIHTSQKTIKKPKYLCYQPANSFNNIYICKIRDMED